MILSQRPEYFSRQVLVTLFLTLQIIACSSEDIAKTIANDVSTGSIKNTGITDVPADRSSADINLSWIAPSERENNEPISFSEIAGYKLYYGKTKRGYANSINIIGGSTDHFTFRNLPAGTYYIAITSYDTTGYESHFSTEVKVVI